MPTSTASAPSLSFPPLQFAKLSPRPYLLAHLNTPTPTGPLRPNGRLLSEFRPATIHTGSLSHADGSAVIRVGSIAVVCGIRTEVLLRTDCPSWRPSSGGDNTDIEELGLLVPNVELSTGCTPYHLPGGPPSALAQTLSARLLALLHSTRLVDDAALRIYREKAEVEGGDEGEKETELVAFWTLHISVLFLSFSGEASAFDAAWAATYAALKDTVLPRAWWDADREIVVCDDRRDQGSRVQLKGWPMAVSVGVVVDRKRARWVLCDVDGGEEGECTEGATVVVDEGGLKVVKLEKWGGCTMGKEAVREMMNIASGRWEEWREAWEKRTRNR